MEALDARLGAALQQGLAVGDWEAAIRDVRLTLVDNSSSPKALLALAVCYFHKRQFTDSIVWLDQAERQARRLVDDNSTEPTWSAIHLFRGLSYAAKRLPTAAKAEFSELRRLDSPPIRWQSFSTILRPDELSRARIAAEGAGLGSAAGRGTG